MQPRSTLHCEQSPRRRQPAWRARIICAGALLLLATGAHAATVYRCADHAGHVVYQDNPCAVPTQQHTVDLHPQPLIGDAGASAHVAAPRDYQHATLRRKPRRVRARHVKPATAWACHAKDGEVFYRFTRCPGSVPGDGVVRSTYAQSRLGTRARGYRNAWSRVRVHGVKITRAEACHNIHAVAASGRDGHLRDANVSTYDHLMGRDPCSSH